MLKKLAVTAALLALLAQPAHAREWTAKDWALLPVKAVALVVVVPVVAAVVILERLTTPNPNAAAALAVLAAQQQAPVYSSPPVIVTQPAPQRGVTCIQLTDKIIDCN